MRVVRRAFHGGVAVLVALAGLTLPQSATAQGGVDFADRLDVAGFSDDQHLGVAMGDLNGDGLPDLLATNYTLGQLSVAFTSPGSAAAAPTFPSHRAFAVGAQPRGLAIGDLNGDGRPDVAVANEGADSVSVLLNTADKNAPIPAFTASRDFNVGDGPRGVAIGDLNADGRPDIAIAIAAAGAVSVLLNETAQGAPTPTFAKPKSFPVGAGPRNVAIVDMNADGRPDVVTANLDDDSVSVLRNITQLMSIEVYFAAAMTSTSGNGSRGMAIGDLNGDTKPDIAVANEADDSLTILLNRTDERAETIQLASGGQLGMGKGPSSVAMGDLNHDGKLDLVVSNRQSGSVSMLVNTSSGGGAQFASRKDLPTGAEPYSVALADLNNDDRDDLLVGTLSSRDVSVFFSRSPSATMAAVPGNTVTVQQPNEAPAGIALAAMPPIQSVRSTSFFPQVNHKAQDEVASIAVGDLNADGMPDVVTVGRLGPVVGVTLSSGGEYGEEVWYFSVGGRPTSVAIADINRDSRPDLVVANRSSDSVSVLINFTAPFAAQPNFLEQRTFGTGYRPSEVAVADFNGDSMPDIAVANSGSGTVTVFLNRSSSGPTQTEIVVDFDEDYEFPAGVAPSSLAAADLNGDGVPDLAVANGGDTYGIIVLLSTRGPNGKWTMSPGVAFDAGDKPGAIAIGDLNSDGRPDLVIANVMFGENVHVLLNVTSTGATRPSFAQKQGFIIDMEADDVAVGDLNGDERPDLAVVSSGSKVELLLNLTPPQSGSVWLGDPYTVIQAKDALSVVIQDVIVDGWPEIISGNHGSFSLRVNLTGLIAP